MHTHTHKIAHARNHFTFDWTRLRARPSGFSIDANGILLLFLPAAVVCERVRHIFSAPFAHHLWLSCYIENLSFAWKQLVCSAICAIVREMENKGLFFLRKESQGLRARTVCINMTVCVGASTGKSVLHEQNCIFTWTREQSRIFI